MTNTILLHVLLSTGTSLLNFTYALGPLSPLRLMISFPITLEKQSCFNSETLPI